MMIMTAGSAGLHASAFRPGLEFDSLPVKGQILTDGPRREWRWMLFQRRIRFSRESGGQSSEWRVGGLDGVPNVDKANAVCVTQVSTVPRLVLVFLLTPTLDRRPRIVNNLLKAHPLSSLVHAL